MAKKHTSFTLDRRHDGYYVNTIDENGQLTEGDKAYATQEEAAASIGESAHPIPATEGPGAATHPEFPPPTSGDADAPIPNVVGASAPTAKESDSNKSSTKKG